LYLSVLPDAAAVSVLLPLTSKSLNLAKQPRGEKRKKRKEKGKRRD
jgi:hypothetical protein